ncbi:MAG: hypothetical protein PHU44_04330 [Syntrophales bacterium]|nr:hypothetical protein [Syntrophales bacterium]MDD5643804.1 hypothetical protein [Syntrophales bacterium]
MVNCPHCRGLVEENAEFCPICQQLLSGAGPVPAGALVQPGKYLRNGWELFKLYPGGFVGFTLLFVFIQAFLNYLPWLGGPISLAIGGPLGVGFYVVSAKLLQRQTPEFRDFFAGFNFFLPLLLVSVISGLLIVLGLVFLILPGIFLMVCYLFPSFIVLDRRLDFWPAMELSRQTVQKQWFGFFVFFLLLILINLGGALALGIGLLVSFPVSACAVAAAYAEIFGLQSDYSGSIPQLKT